MRTAFVRVIAIALVAAMGLGSFFLVARAHDETMPDGFVFYIQPRGATVVGDEVVQTPIGGSYAYDVEVFDADCDPFNFVDWEIALFTIDPQGFPAGSTPAFPPTGSTQDFHHLSVTGVNDGDNDQFAEIAAQDLAFGGLAAAHGFAVYFVLHTDGDDQSMLTDDGDLFAGGFTILGNELYEQGDCESADAADQGFTPLFYANVQPTGLVGVNNPILNPGFEVGNCVDGFCHEGDSGIFPEAELNVALEGEMVLPPWFSRNDVASAAPPACDPDGSGGPAPASPCHVPFSNVVQEIGQGSSGSAAEVHYNAADNGLNFLFAQLIGDQDSDSAPWHAADAVNFKLRLLPGEIPAGAQLRVDVNLFAFGGDDCGVVVTCDLSGRVEFHQSFFPSPSLNWQPLSASLAGNAISDHAKDYPLQGLYFSVSTTPLTASGVFSLDDVVIAGSEFVPEASTTSNGETRADLTDGMAAIIETLGAKFENQELNVGWVQGVDVDGEDDVDDEEKFYLFNVYFMDYSGITPQRVDLAPFAGTGSFVFNVFDQSVFENLAEDTTPGTTNDLAFLSLDGTSGFVHRYVDDSTVLLVGVPESALLAAGLGDNRVVTVWAFLSFADAYEDRLGELHQQVSGYHSLAKRNVAGLSIADQLDYAFSPFNLDLESVGDLVYDTGLALTLLDQGLGNADLLVTGDAELVTNHVLEITGEPSQVVRIDSDASHAQALAGKDFAFPAGSVANLLPTAFSLGAGDSLIAPNANPSFSPLDPPPGHPIQFEDGAEDECCSVVDWNWLFGDGGTSDDEDPVHAYAAPGPYFGSLEVGDDDGLLSLLAPFAVSVGIPAIGFSFDPASPTDLQFIQFQSLVPSGVSVVEYDWDFGDGTGSASANPSKRYADDGTYTVTLTVTFQGGSQSVAVGNVVVSNVAPVPRLDVPEVAALALPIQERRFVAGEEIAFDGCRSVDFDGSILSYRFDFKSGLDPLASTGDGPACTASYTYDTPGSYTLRLTVVDDDAASRSVTMPLVLAENRAPIAVADSPLADEDGVIVLQVGDPGLVEILGSASSDPDTPRTLVAHSWDSTSAVCAPSVGPPVPLPDHALQCDTSVPAVVPWALTVTDTAGATGADALLILVDEKMAFAVELIDADNGNYRMNENAVVRTCANFLSDGAAAAGVSLIMQVSLQGPGDTTGPALGTPIPALTGADGCVTVVVPFDAQGALNVPAKHRVDVVGVVPSRAGDAVDDLEDAAASVQYTVTPRV